MSFALIGKMIANRMSATRSGIAPESPSQPLFHAGNERLKGARVGGLLILSEAFGTLAMADAGGAIFKMPSAGQFSIDAYGRIVDGGFVIHRFYAGDQFLQVITDAGGLLVAGEIKLFQKLTEVNPGSPEEWDMWIKGVGGSPPLLTGQSITWEERTYDRVWLPGAASVEPKRFVETMVAGGDPATVYANTMLFSRRIGESTEWLQLALCRQTTERWIEAYVGLTLEPGEVSAI